jgi:molecular chaperone DnaK
MIQKLTGKVPEVGINPDEVVALGAAVYAANLKEVPVRDDRGRALRPVSVRNVTAHSLGIIVRDEVAEKDVNSIIIKKDTVIPAENTERDYRTGSTSPTAWFEKNL